jgi:hypothetical protein
MIFNGAVTIAEAWEVNSCLPSLDQKGNSIGNEGVITIAEGMKFHSSLTLLYHNMLELRKKELLQL